MDFVQNEKFLFFKNKKMQVSQLIDEAKSVEDIRKKLTDKKLTTTHIEVLETIFAKVPVVFAIDTHRNNAVKFYIKKDPSFLVKENLAIVRWAARENNGRILKAVIEEPENSLNKEKLLVLAIDGLIANKKNEKDTLTLIKYCIDQGVNVHDSDGDFLYVACFLNRVEIIEFFLKNFEFSSEVLNSLYRNIIFQQPVKELLEKYGANRGIFYKFLNFTL